MQAAKGFNKGDFVLRRPFAFLFFSFSAGMAESAFIPEVLASLFLKVMSAMLIVRFCFLEKKKGRESVMIAGFFLFCFFMGGWCFSIAEMKSSALDSQIGEAVLLRGVVKSISENETNMRVLLETEAFCSNEEENIWIPVREKVLLTVKEKEAVQAQSFNGSRIHVKGILELPQSGKNPGGFDYRRYLRSRKIRWVMSVGYGHFQNEVGKVNRVEAGIFQFKQKGIAMLQETFSEEECGLLIGMLFGDKNFMEDTLYESFQRNGTAHILAVSGIHVHLLYLYINRFLSKGTKKKRSVITLLFLLFYAALAEFSPSVVRASLMIAIHILGSLLKKRYDFFNAICLSALLQLVYNPYVIYNVGFQLSYLAVYSLAVILPWCDSQIDRLVLFSQKEWIGSVGRSLSPLLVLQLTMAPLTAFYFNTVSFAAFFSNPPILFLAGMLIPIGMSLLFLCWLPFSGGVLFGMTAQAAALLLQAMLFLNEAFSGWKGGYLWVVSPPYGSLILFYGVVFFFCSELYSILRRRGKRRRIYVVFALTLFFSCSLPWIGMVADAPHPFSRKMHQLTFVDVGQGDCLHLRTPSGKNILIDGGGSRDFNVGKKTLLPYLLKNGVDHIDLAIVTHLHTDHFRGIQELSVFMPITYLGVYEGNRVRTEELALGASYAKKEEEMKYELKTAERIQKETKVLYLKKGERIPLEKGIWLDILAPEGMTDREYKELFLKEDENATSLIIKVSYNGKTVLMTGDLGFEGEESLMNTEEKRKALQSDVLKVGHHGSAYSTSEEFLGTVFPKIAVIQVGKNNFGHPAPRVIELFQKYDIMVKRNDLDGAVFLDKLSPDTIKIENFCNEEDTLR